MDLKDHCITMSQYHPWAFRRLFAQVDSLAEEDYLTDCGLSFGSVHGTLNHLLLVDRLWRTRCRGERFQMRGLDEELVAERAALKDAILQECVEWQRFLTDLPVSRFQEDLDYVNSKGEPATLPFASVVLHVFNHGTHHRGQISAALTRMGRPAPAMDLPYFLLERREP